MWHHDRDVSLYAVGTTDWLCRNAGGSCRHRGKCSRYIEEDDNLVANTSYGVVARGTGILVVMKTLPIRCNLSLLMAGLSGCAH